MSGNDKIVVAKILKHIGDIESYHAGMGFDDFSDDSKTINASAMLLGQIGELAKKLSDNFTESTPHIPWRNVRGMRNRLIHDYENIDLGSSLF